MAAVARHSSRKSAIRIGHSDICEVQPAKSVRTIWSTAPGPHRTGTNPNLSCSREALRHIGFTARYAAAKCARPARSSRVKQRWCPSVILPRLAHAPPAVGDRDAASQASTHTPLGGRCTWVMYRFGAVSPSKDAVTSALMGSSRQQAGRTEAAQPGPPQPSYPQQQYSTPGFPPQYAGLPLCAESLRDFGHRGHRGHRHRAQPDHGILPITRFHRIPRPGVRGNATGNIIRPWVWDS